MNSVEKLTLCRSQLSWWFPIRLAISCLKVPWYCCPVWPRSCPVSTARSRCTQSVRLGHLWPDKKAFVGRPCRPGRQLFPDACWTGIPPRSSHVGIPAPLLPTILATPVFLAVWAWIGAQRTQITGACGIPLWWLCGLKFWAKCSQALRVLPRFRAIFRSFWTRIAWGLWESHLMCGTQRNGA